MSHSPLPLWNYIFSNLGALTVMVFLLIIIVPLVYRKVITKRWQSIRGRVTATASLCGLCWLIAYGDVLVIAVNAQRLCHEETGTKVYKVVETDGFFGGVGMVGWSAYGFKYVEYQSVGFSRLTMVAGKEVRERIDAPTSRYELALEFKVAAFGVQRNTELIRDRSNGEILGDHSSFAIYPGWADGFFLGVTGLTFTPKICLAPDHEPSPGATADSNDFVKAILKPTHVN